MCPRRWSWERYPHLPPLRSPAPQFTLPGAPSLRRLPKPRAPLQVVLLKTGEVAGATYDATTAVVRATSRQVALRPDPPPACRPASALLWGAPPPYTPNPALFSQRFRRAGRAHRRRHAVRDGRRGENGRVGSAPLPRPSRAPPGPRRAVRSAAPRPTAPAGRAQAARAGGRGVGCAVGGSARLALRTGKAAGRVTVLAGGAVGRVGGALTATACATAGLGRRSVVGAGGAAARAGRRAALTSARAARLAGRITKTTVQLSARAVRGAARAAARASARAAGAVAVAVPAVAGAGAAVVGGAVMLSSRAAARAAQLSGLAVLLAARGAAGSVRLGTGAVLLTVSLLPEAGPGV